MTGIDLRETLKTLKGERVKVQQNLTKLDKAIAVLTVLADSSTASTNGHAVKRTMSAAGRRRIAKAQRLRWAKVKQQKAAKN